MLQSIVSQTVRALPVTREARLQNGELQPDCECVHFRSGPSPAIAAASRSSPANHRSSRPLAKAICRAPEAGRDDRHERLRERHWEGKDQHVAALRHSAELLTCLHGKTQK